jgi:hypothetical protein
MIQVLGGILGFNDTYLTFQLYIAMVANFVMLFFS